MVCSGLLRRVALVRFLRSVRRLLDAACVVPSAPIFVTLMKGAPGSSETSVLTRATRRNNPGDTILMYTFLRSHDTFYAVTPCAVFLQAASRWVFPSCIQVLGLCLHVPRITSCSCLIFHCCSHVSLFYHANIFVLCFESLAGTERVR
jgi:hypothetical protein